VIVDGLAWVLALDADVARGRDAELRVSRCWIA